MLMDLLLIGGAGYVGSATLRALQAQGHNCTVLDDLSTGHRAAADGAKFIQGSFFDQDLMGSELKRGQYDAVLHFAALALVGESVRSPELYWRANVAASTELLEAMRRHGPKRIVFSSSAAVYGRSRSEIITEDHPMEPVNPYGRTKLAFEWAIEDYCHAHGFTGASLRYFNAAGADPDGNWGEDHLPETHLIPNVLNRAAHPGEAVAIFGADYDTPDGTCVRDYVHVLDLAEAHALVLQRHQEGEYFACNLGTSAGVSVREVIETAARVTGRQIPWRVASRRPGDPARLVASCEKARKTLGWAPRYSDLQTVLEHAWAWHMKNPQGYADRPGCYGAP